MTRTPSDSPSDDSQLPAAAAAGGAAGDGSGAADGAAAAGSAGAAAGDGPAAAYVASADGPAAAAAAAAGESQVLTQAQVEARWKELAGQLGVLQQTDLPASGPRDYAVEDDDEPFVPPDPDIRLNPASPQVRLGWFLLILGLVGLFTAFITHAPGAVGIASLLFAVGGFVTLVLALPRNHADDDANGAVV